MSSTVHQLPAQGSVIALLGINGWVSGEYYALKPGDDVIIGRSRSCDISLRRCRGYVERDRETRDNDHEFNTVSRRHVHLTVLEDYVLRLEDLSTNGTYLDDALMSDTIDIQTQDRQAVLRLGMREALRIQVMEVTALRALMESQGGAAHPGSVAAGANDKDLELDDEVPSHGLAGRGETAT